MTLAQPRHDDTLSPSPRPRSRAASIGLAAAIVLAAVAAGCGSAIDSASQSSGGRGVVSGPGSGSGSGEGSEGGEGDDEGGGSSNGGTSGGGTSGGGTSGGGTSGGGTSGGGNAGSGSGVPCDVAQVLSTHCLSCHGQPLAGGAPVSLATYADLMAVSPSYAPATELARSIARMEDAQSPMPPGQPGAVSASEIAILKTWLANGAPQGSCGGAAGGGGGAGNPFGAPAQCSSGVTSNPEEGDGMAPGHACLSCHTGQGEAPHFTIAGTVYPTAHEPNDCQSTGVAGTTIEITDANGQVTTLSVGASGNFHSSKSIATPYSAKLVFQGRERAMGTHPGSGDCNGCHTQAGANGAPGRLLLP